MARRVRRGRRHPGAPARPGDHRQHRGRACCASARTAPDVHRRLAPPRRTGVRRRSRPPALARSGGPPWANGPGRNLLNALLRGEELSTADTAWAMGEIMAGSATPAQIAGFAVALRAKGETPAELAGLVEAMLARAVPVALPEELRADRARRGRHRRRPGPHGQHLHDGRAGGRRRRASAWSSTATAPPPPRAAPPTCWSTSAFRWTSARSRWPAASTEAGIGFCFAARFHPGHAARRPGPPRDRRAHRVQLPRPADQPGPAPGRRGGLLRPADGPGDGGRLRRAAATR